MSASPWKTFLLLLTVGAIGCSKTPEGRLTVYPVSGKVTAKGQPVEAPKLFSMARLLNLQGPARRRPLVKPIRTANFDCDRTLRTTVRRLANSR